MLLHVVALEGNCVSKNNRSIAPSHPLNPLHCEVVIASKGRLSRDAAK